MSLVVRITNTAPMMLALAAFVLAFADCASSSNPVGGNPDESGSIDVTVEIGSVALDGATVTISGPGVSSRSGTTDADGGVQFEGLAAGEYTVTLSGDYDCTFGQERTITLDEGQSRSVSFECTIPPEEGTLEASVIQSGGAGVQAVALNASCNNGFSETQETGSDGTARWDIAVGDEGTECSAEITEEGENELADMELNWRPADSGSCPLQPGGMCSLGFDAAEYQSDCSALEVPPWTGLPFASDVCNTSTRNMDLSPTQGSSDALQGTKAKTGTWSQIVQTGARVVYLTQAALDALVGINDPQYPRGTCGFCEPLTPGFYLVAFTVVAEPIPVASPDRFIEMNFLFQRAGSPAEGYGGPPDFPYDWWNNGHYLYGTRYDPGTGTWGFLAGEWDAENTQVLGINTSANWFFFGNVFMFVAPMSDFDDVVPGVRSTVFEHNGDFGLGQDQDWAGDVQPPQGRASDECPFAQVPTLSSDQFAPCPGS